MTETSADRRVDDLRSEMHRGFERVDKRFEQVEKRFERVEGDIGELRGRHAFVSESAGFSGDALQFRRMLLA